MLGWTTVQETDYSADGVIDTLSSSTYAYPGILYFRETDYDADGVVEILESYDYIYDINGRLWQIHTDDWMDGVVDEIKTYHYDSNGRLESYDIDVGPDGVLNRIDTYIYDATGRRVGWEMDSDADLLVDTLYSYIYDDSTGTLDSLIIERFNDDLVITSTSWYTYTYNAQGKMAYVHVDLTGDGILDNTTAYLYDAVGRMNEALVDLGRDGTDDSHTIYFYNPQTGDLDKIEMDTDYDGLVDTRVVKYELCYDGS
jgi:hypothetical protein